LWEDIAKHHHRTSISACIEIQVGVSLNNSTEYVSFIENKLSDDNIYTTSCQCGLDSVAQVKKCIKPLAIAVTMVLDI
jgi:hypothetical protein